MVTLTATNALGCSATFVPSYSGNAVNVFSCTPRISATARVVSTLGVTTAPNGSENWVCGNGSMNAPVGSYTMLLEPGASYTRATGGFQSIFVRAGATLTSNSGGTTIIISEPGATVNNPGMYAIYLV